MPIFAIFGHFLAIFGRFGPFLDREHQKQCNCNLLGATGPTNYINMVSNSYLEIWSVSDPKTNSWAKQDPKLTWGGQNWSFCTLCSPTNLFYTKNVNSEMVTSKSYFLAWNRPTSCNYLRQGPGCPPGGSLGQSRLLLRSWPNQCKATGGPQKVSSCIKTFF